MHRILKKKKSTNRLLLLWLKGQDFYPIFFWLLQFYIWTLSTNYIHLILFSGPSGGHFLQCCGVRPVLLRHHAVLYPCYSSRPPISDADDTNRILRNCSSHFHWSGENVVSSLSLQFFVEMRLFWAALNVLFQFDIFVLHCIEFLCYR